jgi:hypothetical protein
VKEPPVRRTCIVSLLGLFGLLGAGCADDGLRITTNACEEDMGPGISAWADSLDTDGDDTINSDEFNASFEDVVNEMDGRTTVEAFRQKICSQPPYSN